MDDGSLVYKYNQECINLVIVENVWASGSSHRNWFEDHADKCCLLVYIDDATGSLMTLRFSEVESTYDYMNATRDYVEKHGKPVAFYSDKHSVFRLNCEEIQGGKKMTQFGRVLFELNIELICANSSQAKGRVERANKTLQDRLIKEMRLASLISYRKPMPDYQALLKILITHRFSRTPYSLHYAHRPLRESSVKLENINEPERSLVP